MAFLLGFSDEFVDTDGGGTSTSVFAAQWAAECCLHELVSTTTLCCFVWWELLIFPQASPTTCGDTCGKINSLVPFRLLVPATNTFVNHSMNCSFSIYPESNRYRTHLQNHQSIMCYISVYLYTPHILADTHQLLSSKSVRCICILSRLPPFCVGFYHIYRTSSDYWYLSGSLS